MVSAALQCQSVGHTLAVKENADMKKQLILVLLFMIFLSTTTHAQQEVPFSGDRLVTLMTHNLYSGVDDEIFAIPSASSFTDLLIKVAAVYNGYFARDFPARAERIASEVAATRPDLIALQEAILVRTQSPPDGPATPATDVKLDFIQILQAALQARGLNYDMIAQSPGFDAELPSALGFDVRHTEREVILARADLKVADMKLSNAQIGNFVTNCTIPSTLVGPITLTRGWASVDVKIRGKSFRLLSTHLDPICLPTTPLIQLGQAAELLAGPGNTDLPLVLAGDFNSPADGTGVTYNTLIGTGLMDSWNFIGLGNGFTCCQAPHLDNFPSSLNQRIDFVFFRGQWTALAAVNVGQNPEDRTPSLLWPSDHAGLVVKLKLPQP
jgi:endonuclease/exonuclease/phosphatase family metal-dependent hydrolase